MPTLPIPEEPEPDRRAEQARAVVRAATRSLGATERHPFVQVVALFILAVAGSSNPNPVTAALAAICAVVIALGMR